MCHIHMRAIFVRQRLSNRLGKTSGKGVGPNPTSGVGLGASDQLSDQHSKAIPAAKTALTQSFSLSPPLLAPPPLSLSPSPLPLPLSRSLVQVNFQANTQTPHRRRRHAMAINKDFLYVFGLPLCLYPFGLTYPDSALFCATVNGVVPHTQSTNVSMLCAKIIQSKYFVR